jgi:hypothetical protein
MLMTALWAVSMIFQAHARSMVAFAFSEGHCVAHVGYGERKKPHRSRPMCFVLQRILWTGHKTIAVLCT